MPVTFERFDDYAVVTIDNAPVNAIGRSEREGLLAAVMRAETERGLRGVIVQGQGRMFAAGADTREFDGAPLPPQLPDVLDAMERASVPWIAALRGAALGGGCEIALGCRLRIAAPDVTIGLPEVTLGVVPGAGGTQRLPRLIGYPAALSLIAEGRVAKAAEALTLGLVDQIAEDPLAAALTVLRAGTIAAGEVLSQRPRPIFDAAAEAEAIDRANKKMRGQIAPHRAIGLVLLSTRSEFAEGASAERTMFLDIRTGAQAKALRHMFFAERGARPSAELARVTPRDIKRAGVVGGGTMGAGIAYALVRIGIPVMIVETDADAVLRAQQNVDRLFADSVKRGLVDAARAAALAEMLGVSDDFERLRDVDLVIEAAFEDFAAKRTIFERLDAVAPAHAILATNTSYLDVDEIAATTRRPQDVLGLHFFSPAHIMRLLEIVRATETSDVALATGFALATKLKKIPVISGVCDGFIGNRILARYREAADTMLMDGGLPWEVDEAMVAFGYPMGPYEAQDLSGLDIAYANRKRWASKRDPHRRYVTISDRMVEEGRLGKKVGVGWYRYPGGGGAVVDPLLEDLIRDEAHFAKVTRRSFDAEEIRHRLLLAMINEAADILHEGIAASADAIDLVTVHGYGFPRWRGGLMHYAESLGYPRLVADLQALATEDPVAWKVSKGLLALAANAKEKAAAVDE